MYSTFPSVTNTHSFPLSSFQFQSTCKFIMTEFHITKKWREKGKVLRSIIHGTILGTNKFKFKFKPFATDDHHKVHNTVEHACIEEFKDSKKEGSVFYKVGLLPSLVRVPSRGLRKLGRAVSMRKYEDGDGRLELCKKRIIMGKKCRPLNVSGALHYDNNGVLVPEDFLLSPCNHLL